MPYQCRICLDEQNDLTNMIVPCKCRGSAKYVHRKCLNSWIETFPPHHPHAIKCNTCQFTYLTEGFGGDKMKQYKKAYTREILKLVGLLLLSIFCLVYIFKCITMYNPTYSSITNLLYFMGIGIIVMGLYSGNYTTHSMVDLGLAGATHIFNHGYQYLALRVNSHHKRIFSNADRILDLRSQVV
jgi:hypothetical protein